MILVQVVPVILVVLADQVVLGPGDFGPGGPGDFGLVDLAGFGPGGDPFGPGGPGGFGDPFGGPGGPAGFWIQDQVAQ